MRVKKEENFYSIETCLQRLDDALDLYTSVLLGRQILNVIESHIEMCLQDVHREWLLFVIKQDLESFKKNVNQAQDVFCHLRDTIFQERKDQLDYTYPEDVRNAFLEFKEFFLKESKCQH